MKVLSKLKKVVMGIGTFIIALPVKIYAVLDYKYQILYGPAQEDYGIPKEEPNAILGIIRILIVPILLLIGLIAIIKNKKMSKTSKIIMGVVATIIAIVIFLILGAMM